MINILPINDLKEHTENSACECKPKVEFIDSEILVIHNSYDGREQYEKMQEQILEQSKIIYN